MPDHSSSPSIEDDCDPNLTPADIQITVHGDRRALETFYLQLRELAKHNGLTIDYRLSIRTPAARG
jgi:hypothetical protein